MSDQVRYAVCCKGCGHVEDKAWSPEGPIDAHSKKTNEPLTPRSRVPICCQQCGKQSWQVPATKEQLEAFDAKQRQTLRVVELTKAEHFEGLFKIPPSFNKAAPEVKRALSNLLGPLEGDVLKAAISNLDKVALSGMQGDSLAWVDYCDRAVQRALPPKGSKVIA